MVKEKCGTSRLGKDMTIGWRQRSGSSTFLCSCNPKNKGQRLAEQLFFCFSPFVPQLQLHKYHPTRIVNDRSNNAPAPAHLRPPAIDHQGAALRIRIVIHILAIRFGVPKYIDQDVLAQSKCEDTLKQKKRARASSRCTTSKREFRGSSFDIN